MRILLFTTSLIGMFLASISCNSSYKGPKEDDIIKENKMRDSIASAEQVNEIITTALYQFEKDSTRKEWIESHPYMCYTSSDLINETNGYDKNGKRLTNQLLGEHKEQNTICVDRRKKMIIWNWIRKGMPEEYEFPIKQIDEYQHETSFGVTDANGEKYVFNVPDNGRKISFLSYDKTIIFIVDR